MAGSKHQPKWQKVYDRLAENARDKVDNVPYVEKVIDAADVRSEGFREVRDDLAPLRRLVISYTKGSYRDVSKGTVAQALAAISYVASPVDAIPDTLPGGLKDDAKVVAWVSDRLSGDLDTYAEWEQSLGPPTELERLVTSTLTLARSSDMEVSLVAEDEALLAAGSSAGIDSVAAMQQAVLGSERVIDALHEGMRLRVLGPKHLIKGVNQGTHALVKTQSGQIGTVRELTSGKIDGHLRIGVPGAAQAAKATVSVGWAVASAVTMQHYLGEIDSKLAGMKHELKDLHDEKMDEQLGQLDTALQRCQEVQVAVERTGGLTDQDISALERADDRADDVFNALARTLGRFGEEVEQTVSEFASVEKDNLARLLGDGGEKRITQLRMLLYAACVRDRINAFRVLAAGEDGEERMQLAEERLEREHVEMREAVVAACAALRRLHIPKGRLDDRWPHLGGPEKELIDFVAAVERLAAEAPDSAEGEAATLAGADAAPALPAPNPFLTEFWIQDGELVAEKVEVTEYEAGVPHDVAGLD